MKNRTKPRHIALLSTIFSALLLSCSSDDGPSNQSPEKAALTSPAENSQGLEIENLNLLWQQVTDPDGDAVSYDVFLDSINPPAAMVAADLNTTAHSVQGPLEYDTPYYWRVTAKDGNGGTSQSEVAMFTTREATPAELIVGKWLLDQLFINGTPQTLADCEKNTFFEFDANGMLSIVVYDGNPCMITSSTIAQYSVPNATTLIITEGGTTDNLAIVSLTETGLKFILGSGQYHFLKDN